MAGWIGVDLDGTLAEYDGWRGVNHIGKPIEAMAARVKGWVEDGVQVRIVTARVSGDPAARHEAKEAIKAWLFKHGLPPLSITNEKDFEMIELWDDRAVQVIPNTGLRADGRE